MLDFSKNDNIFQEVNSSSEFYSQLRKDKKQDAPVTHAHRTNIHQKLMNEYIIKPNESTTWEEIDIGSNQYRFALAVYLVTTVLLKLNISIDR